eukprot:1160109-Pelagomonas_calceolata.AAC.1
MAAHDNSLQTRNLRKGSPAEQSSIPTSKHIADTIARQSLLHAQRRGLLQNTAASPSSKHSAGTIGMSILCCVCNFHTCISSQPWQQRHAKWRRTYICFVSHLQQLHRTHTCTCVSSQCSQQRHAKSQIRVCLFLACQQLRDKAGEPASSGIKVQVRAMKYEPFLSCWTHCSTCNTYCPTQGSLSQWLTNSLKSAELPD